MSSAKEWQKAVKDTLPVLMGYSAMGMAAGILLAGSLPQLPWAPAWAAFSSALSESGALQFILVGWIRDQQPLVDVLLLTICLNLRYAMYGFSLIQRFEKIPKWKKFYLVWTLADETYALQCADQNPDKNKSVSYCLKVAFLDHCYWISGVTAGALIGTNLPFNAKGIDFAMTALYLVILVDQLRDRKNRTPALIGFGCAAAARCFFSLSNMLIPAMALMIGVFLLFKGKIEKTQGRKKA